VLNNQESIIRAAIYVRVSTDEQVIGYGLDVQRERCRAQIIAKGWQLVNEYSDEGISGTKDESQRPGLSALLQSAKDGEIDAVIVLALDRLARKTLIVLKLVEKLSDYKVTIVSCKESLDTSTPQGQFVLTMFAAVAQLERDTIVQRTTAGRDVRGALDGEKGGRLPLGYVREGEVITIDPEWSSIVRVVFEMRANKHTLQNIADRLSDIKPIRYGKRWYPSTVKSVLANREAYYGGQRGLSDKHWPRILD
jgi:site-specific DNA recombinase